MQLDHPLGTKHVLLAFFAKISARENYVVATIGEKYIVFCTGIMCVVAA
jgi:hypothetical protein